MSQITDRETAIRHIEGLFPPDSLNPENAQTGQMLLKQARQQVKGWRTEPTEVLIRLAELCIQRELEDDARREVEYERRHRFGVMP